MKEAPLGTSTVLTLVTRWHRYMGYSKHQRWDSPGQQLEEHAHSAATLVLKFGLSIIEQSFGFTSHLCHHPNRLLQASIPNYPKNLNTFYPHSLKTPMLPNTPLSPLLHVPILTFQMSPISPAPKSLPCLCHLLQAHSSSDAHRG